MTHLGLARFCPSEYRNGQKVIEFMDAVANFNYWTSISYRLKGKVEMQPEDIADELDKLWGKIKGTLPDGACIDPVLSRAAGFITAMDPGDEDIAEGPKPLSHMGRRVKASAPLVILWLEEKMGMEAVREQGSREECQMIENALREL